MKKRIEIAEITSKERIPSQPICRHVSPRIPIVQCFAAATAEQGSLCSTARTVQGSLANRGDITALAVLQDGGESGLLGCRTYSTVLYGNVLSCTVQYCTVQYSTVQSVVGGASAASMLRCQCR